MEVYLVDIDMAIALDGVMIKKAAKKQPDRDIFFNIEKETLSEHINNVIPITLLDYVIERIKLKLYRTGQLQKIKMCKKRQ